MKRLKLIRGWVKKGGMLLALVAHQTTVPASSEEPQPLKFAQNPCLDHLSGQARGKIELGGLALDSGPHPRFEEIFYRNQKIKGLQAQFDPSLKSYRYFLSPKRVPQDAQVMLTMLHGMGALATSHSGSTVGWARTFYGLDKTGRRIHTDWESLGKSKFTIAAESFDLPESGNGPSAQNELSYQTIEGTLGNFNEYQKNLRQEGSKKCRFGWLGQSASAELITAFARKFPQHLDFVILVGPLHRAPEIGFTHSVELIENWVRLPQSDPRYLEINQPAFDWVNQRYGELLELRPFDPLEDPTGGKPLLILVGELDPQIPPTARAHFKSLSEKFDHIWYEEIPQAGHAVFTPHGPTHYKPDYAFQTVLRFLDEKVGVLP